MTLYNIEHTDGDYTVLYVDPFTNEVFEGTQLEAQKIIFLLNDQQKGSFDIKEAKQ